MKKIKILVFSFVIAFSSCHSNEIESPKISSNQEDIIRCTFDFMDWQNNTSKQNAAILEWPVWENGQTIKIKFLDGDSATQEKVKRIANEWTLYANLKFEYVSKDEYADIRIGFDRAGELGTEYGAWSELGKRSAYGSNLNRQTMRLGPLTASESSVRQTILHEFGHALGLVHENASPASKINWDMPKVYKYYNEYSKEQVDRMIMKTDERTNYSEYDPLSIMHYYIPASITTDGVGVQQQTQLSIIDKVSINKWYPFPIVSVLESGQSLHDLPWNKRIKSPNGRYSLEFDTGLLKILDLTDNSVIWEVGDYNYRRKPSCYFESTTGNIIINGAKSTFADTIVTWTSDTFGFPDAKLYLQDDGNLELIHDGIVRWSSKTGKS